MSVGAIGNAFSIPYNYYSPMMGARAVTGTAAADETGRAEGANGVTRNNGESKVKEPGRKSSPAECKTCAERKYKDGSNENDVSFQSATHISPTAAGAAVRAHEQEHVANAYEKEKMGKGEVLQASVRIMTAVCPECGRTYVSGGETTTKIRYHNEDNPYQKARKKADSGLLPGMNFDASA